MKILSKNLIFLQKIVVGISEAPLSPSHKSRVSRADNDLQLIDLIDALPSTKPVGIFLKKLDFWKDVMQKNDFCCTF